MNEELRATGLGLWSTGDLTVLSVNEILVAIKFLAKSSVYFFLKPTVSSA